jgi:hypothetical protein
MTRKIIYLTVMARRSMELGVGGLGPRQEVEVNQPVVKLVEYGKQEGIPLANTVPEMKRQLRDTLRVTRDLRQDLAAERLLAILKERDPGLYEEVRKVLGG